MQLFTLDNKYEKDLKEKLINFGLQVFKILEMTN